MQQSLACCFNFSNPTPTPVQSPYNNTMITWPRFDISDNLKVLNLDGEIRIDENYRQQDYAFYIDYLSYIGGRPVANKAKGLLKFIKIN